MYENKSRTTINVNKNYFSLYQEITSKPEWGTGSNLKLFTVTVLIGKYIVGKKIPIKDNSHTYLRVRDNDKKDDMALLKCFAVLESGDWNILKDEDAMFSICEDYTTAGILKLKEWYETNEEDIEDILSDNLFEKFNINSEQFFEEE
ncbi:MAG: hypothetical protein MR750_01420 [Methanobrevibacter boviskoreani]|uniref:hypothetical protein n=1 Tax=Methanobrevibacter boviskoreani TaxID=1348249 RepID=UPI0023A86F7E|nr:hypothetical protein [Methanobrevibacter boviskoreani]MCI6929902.1 hypothetical protein [Methanobrevibacter boviskoreani]